MRAVAELFDHIDELRKTGGRVAVATLVNTRGTTPRKEGAKMVVGEGGRVLGSVTIGGCVDAQVIEESDDVLTAMRPRLLELNLGDEEAWEIGLTCGGTIEVFLEPVALDQPGDDTLALLRAGARPRRARAGAAPSSPGSTRRERRQAPPPRRRHRRGHASAIRSSTDALRRRGAREAMRAGQVATLFLEGVRAFVEVLAPPAHPGSWSARATWPCRS